MAGFMSARRTEEKTGTMNKEQFTTYIRNFLEIEDGVAIKLTQFLKEVLKNSEIEEELKKEIKSQLEILVVDGEKHISLVRRMEHYINESQKDEF
jgi:hypothetical protein